MDTHTMNVLEFSALKNLVAGYSMSELGKKQIALLAPVADSALITQRHQRIGELMMVLADTKSIPGEGVPDISEIVEKMHIEGTILDTEGFMQLWNFVRKSRQLRKFLLADDQVDIPELKKFAELIPQLIKLEKALAFVFTEDGKIKDEASSRLKSIRKEIKEIRKSVLEKLHHIIEDKKGHDCFNNDQITLREGRYVLFVKSEMRASIEGVIHDKSMSGATCFIEPAEVIGQGNRLRALTFDERNEILRIKRFLSGLVRDDLTHLETILALLSEFECLLACARFGVKHSMICPELSDNQKLTIIEGRHPLLLERIGSHTIPLSLELTDENHSIIITGPNMGGKTVALKTLGLLCLMFQCGMPVPVKKGSCFPLYTALYADVGDEQNLQTDMSTFSSHITRIKDILIQNEKNTLVLLDEFGTGTDPAEGAALAIAILEEMISRGIFVVANTHLYQLKLFASQKKGVRNASLLFDEKTHRPTYQLVMDIPGSSNALEIAKRLGLPSNIIYTAHKALGKTSGELDSLINELHKVKIDLNEEKNKWAEERKTSQLLMRKYRDKVMKFEEEKNKVLAKKLTEMEDAIKSIKHDFEEAVQKIELKDENVIKNARKKWESFHHNIKDERDNLEPVEEALEGEPHSKPVVENWKKGDVVVVAPFMMEGTIVAINEKQKKAVVLSENRRIEVSLNKLSRKIDEPGHPRKEPVMNFHISPQARSAFHPTLDLRGMYVDDALPRLEKHLSDAILLGFKTVTIIHGLGTGRLKKAVKEFLEAQSSVKRIRDGGEGEGGLGVTVVEL